MLGVVVIGRNEGVRLERCLLSSKVYPCVYVDSGSTDGSVDLAKSLGAEVVPLDLSLPFTAARARNEGFNQLLAINPHLEYVMFVDGDCEIQSQWFAPALDALQQDKTLAAVCGRRRERFPEASIYNQMCDIEWDTPVGKAKSCGGDAIYRVDAFQCVSGFDEAFIAGEEPELCFRLRERHYSIERLDLEMTFHDAALTRFSQWWRRAERSGHAYFLGWKKHGGSAERFCMGPVRSICFWAPLFLALLVLSVVALWWLPVVVAVALFVLQSFRVSKNLTGDQVSLSAKRAYGVFTVLGKLPQFFGVVRAALRVALKRKATLIEYK